jgi:hypothetical protein
VGLAQTLRRWRSDWAAAQEFSQIGSVGQQVIGRDLGAGADTLRRLIGRGSRGAELIRVLQSLDLPPKAVARAYPGVMQDMQVTCSLCSLSRQCRQALASGDTSLTYQRQHCSNMRTLTDLDLGALAAYAA